MKYVFMKYRMRDVHYNWSIFNCSELFRWSDIYSDVTIEMLHGMSCKFSYGDGRHLFLENLE